MDDSDADILTAMRASKTTCKSNPNFHWIKPVSGRRRGFCSPTRPPKISPRSKQQCKGLKDGVWIEPQADGEFGYCQNDLTIPKLPRRSPRPSFMQASHARELVSQFVTMYTDYDTPLEMSPVERKVFIRAAESLKMPHIAKLARTHRANQDRRKRFIEAIKLSGTTRSSLVR